MTLNFLKPRLAATTAIFIIVTAAGQAASAGAPPPNGGEGIVQSANSLPAGFDKAPSVTAYFAWTKNAAPASHAISATVLPTNGGEGIVQTANSLPTGFAGTLSRFDTAAPILYATVQPTRSVQVGLAEPENAALAIGGEQITQSANSLPSRFDNAPAGFDIARMITGIFAPAPDKATVSPTPSTMAAN
jgi:hypothetical protein